MTLRLAESPAIARRVMFSLLVVCAACDEDLPKATEVIDMRILGAEVQVVGDPTRATPKPGEKVDVDFVTVHPTMHEDDADAQTMLVSCTQPTRYTGGLPICQEFLDAAFGAEVDVQAVLDIATRVRCFDLKNPERTDEPCDNAKNPCVYEVGTMAIRCIDGPPNARVPVSRAFAGDEMLYRGVVCERGDAYIDVEDPLLFDCDGNDGETTRVHGTVAIQHEAADANHNPDLSGLRVFLGTPADEDETMMLETDARRRRTTGSAWPFVAPDELPEEDACLGTAPECDADAEAQTGVLCQYAYGNFRLVLQYDPALRETVDGEVEDLEFSVFATDGELERRFVVFERELEPVPVSRPVVCRTDADCDGHADAYCHALNCVRDVEDKNDTTGRPKRVQVTENAEVLQGTVDWQVPDELKGRSQLVRFFFTAVDRRGGFAVTSRALCLN